MPTFFKRPTTKATQRASIVSEVPLRFSGDGIEDGRPSIDTEQMIDPLRAEDSIISTLDLKEVAENSHPKRHSTPTGVFSLALSVESQDRKISKMSKDSFLRSLKRAVKDFVGSKKDEESETQSSNNVVEVPVRVKSSFLSKLMPKPEILNGSSRHDHGDCNSCGFYYKGRCNAGMACEYCHLCSKGDVRRRNRKKRNENAETEALNTSWATI
jgi:hypothetical protein